MRSFKHLPTKLTFVKSILRQPHIRHQHYNPNKQKILDLVPAKYKKDINQLLYLIGFKGEDPNVDDVINHMNTLSGFNKQFADIAIPLYILLRKNNISTDKFKKYISILTDKKGILYESLFIESTLFDTFSRALAYTNDYDFTVNEINYLFKEIGLLEKFNSMVVDNSMITIMLNNYFNVNFPKINSLKLPFIRLIKNNFEVKNQFEYMVKSVYMVTQEYINSKNYKLNRFYRGMSFIKRNADHKFMIKTPSLASTSIDEDIAYKFANLDEIENVLSFTDYNKFKEKTGEQIFGRDKLSKHVNLNYEYIEYSPSVKGLGYLIGFEPKTHQQIFGIFHGDALGYYKKRLGKELAPVEFEKEVIILI